MVTLTLESLGQGQIPTFVPRGRGHHSEDQSQCFDLRNDDLDQSQCFDLRNDDLDLIAPRPNLHK